MKKKIIPVLILFSLIFYFFVGIFVVQPIGALPEGATVLYWRINTKLPFITSPDGWVIDQGQKLSLLTRGMAMNAIGKIVSEKKIANLPYSKRLYLISTGGKEFTD